MKKIEVSDIAILLLLTIGAFIIVIPIIYMVNVSLMSAEEIAAGSSFWPTELNFDNYLEAFKKAPFLLYTKNTLVVAFFCVIGAILSNSFIGYGFSKIEFKGREAIFRVVMGTMMIPAFVTLVPTFVLFTKLGWYGTYLPLIVPLYFGNAFHIFMFRQFYKTIPNELIEAAKIDGSGHFQIYYKLMLPLVKPLLATIALIVFKGVWNDFQGPLLYLDDQSMYTIQLGLNVFKSSVGTQWNYLMAMSLYSMLPLIILFFMFQNYFVQGLSTSGSNK